MSEGGQLSVGNLRLQFLHVPGHAADHLTVYQPAHHLRMTGDLIFVGKVGGTKTDEDARVEWDSLQRVLKAIPSSATIWPATTMARGPAQRSRSSARPTRSCLADVDGFLEMKREWPDYKKRLGLR